MSPDSSSSTHAGLAAALALFALLAWSALRPVATPLPAPLPVDAPAAQFSAGRAAAHLAALARTPRPIASPMNRQARDYLLAQLEALGLAPQVQRALVRKNYVDYNANYETVMAVVHNVLVRLPGSAPDRAQRPALLLVAHYDSDGASLGVARAAPGAALLDTLRALRAGSPPANDIVVLFTDGERVGGLGLQAFVEQHPWAREVGLALRFDGAGSSGALELVDTAHANSAAVAGWLRAAPDVRGSSLLQEVGQLVPGTPRIGSLSALRVPTLQFANRGSPVDRAGLLDTPQRYRHASLQHMGENMLNLARHFGQQRLDPRPGAGRVIFALPVVGTVHYDARLAWPLALAACLLLARAWRRAGVPFFDLLRAFFIVPCIAVVLGILAWQVWMHVPALHRAWNPAAPDHARSALLYLGGIAALCCAVFAFGQRQLVRLTGTLAAALAALSWLTLVLLVASWLAPGASYLVAWPLLAALLALPALRSDRVRAWPRAARAALLLGGVLPALLLVPPSLRDSYLALSPQRMNVPVAMLALLLGVALPLLVHARRYLARSLLLAGLGALALASRADDYVEPPALRADALVYYKDMPTWDAYWLHPEGELDPWTRQLFPNLRAPHVFMEVFGWDSPRRWYGWAPRDGLAFPFVRVLRNGKAPDRHAEFTLASHNRAPEIRLRVMGARPTRLAVNGQVLLDAEAKTLNIVLYGMDDATLHFRIDVLGDPKFAVRVEEVLPGLPQHLLAARPDTPPRVPMSAQSIAADTLWFSNLATP